MVVQDWDDAVVGCVLGGRLDLGQDFFVFAGEHDQRGGALDGYQHVAFAIDLLSTGDSLILEVSFLHVLEHSELPILPQFLLFLTLLINDTDEVQPAPELSLGDRIFRSINTGFAQIEHVNFLFQL